MGRRRENGAMEEGWMGGNLGEKREFPDSDLASLNSDANCNKFECTYSM